MNSIKLALDWTPNINHIGFFVAQQKGFYNEDGLEVEIMDPSADNYSLTPAKKVERGLADFALCPTESVISYRTKQKPFGLIAVAAVLQNDLSAIAVKSSSKIDSPRDLDGKIYSSYEARYEDGIVQEMIKNDGGKGNIEIIYPEKLGIWDSLIQGKSDATWVFLNWEGVEAKDFDEDLTYFKLADYGIPYSYSPVIVADESKLDERLVSYQSFIKATREGFVHAAKEQAEATSILQRFIPEKDKNIDLHAALKMTAPHFLAEGKWGNIQSKRLQDFLQWLRERNLEDSSIEVKELFTNRLLG